MKVYYVRLNFIQLQAVRQDAARLWQMTADPAFDDAALIGGREEFEQLSEALTALAGQSSSLTGAAGLPIGLLLTAIAGSSMDVPCPDAIEIAPGTGYVLSPVTVQTLSAGMKEVSVEALRAALTAGKVSGAGAAANVDTASLTAALTAFAVLQRFYVTAAGYGQYMLVARV